MGDGALPGLAAQMLNQGPALVLVTEGAEGVTAYGAGGAVRMPARRVEVVDTVGAGDTFNAGFLAGLADAGMLDKSALRAGLPTEVLEAALSLGVRAAAVTVGPRGREPAAPRRPAVRALIQRVSQARVEVAGVPVGQTGPGLLILGLRHPGRYRGAGRGAGRQRLRKLARVQGRGRQDEPVAAGHGRRRAGRQPSSRWPPIPGAATGRAFRPPHRPRRARRFTVTSRRRWRRWGRGSRTGQFGADMAVSLTNDGPVTIWL